jgi:adenylate cyclase
MFLGEVLRQNNIINSEQLQHALAVQKERVDQLGKSVRLGMIIVELKYASENELVEVINSHYGLNVGSTSDNIEGLVRKKRADFAEIFPAPRLPIWIQLSIATTIITVLTILTLSVIFLNRQEERLYQQTTKIGMVSLNYFGRNSSVPLLQEDVLGLNTMIKDAANVEGVLYAFIVDNHNIIQAHTDYTKIGTTFGGIAHTGEETADGDITYFNYYDASGEQVLNLSRPVTFQDKKLGVVHVGVSIDFIQQVIRKERSVIILLTVIIIFFVILISILLGFHFSRPISKLVKATCEIRKGNYKHMVDLERNDELGLLAKAFNHMSHELRMKFLMQKSFGKYVGFEVLDMIMDNPESAWLKGHRNEATIIFTDIRGFTSYADEREPEAVVENLNQCFEIQTRAILENGGYVDKFIGDAVLGVFGVPVYYEDHVKRAVKAALEMQKALNNAAQNGNKLLSSIGIAINTGIVVSGNIGSQVKMEYTVIGDSVNVASRLNGLADVGEVIISKQVYEKLKNAVVAEALPPHRIKGKPEPIETYKVLALKG